MSKGIEEKKLDRIEVKELLFDDQNYRLAEGAEGMSQQNLLEIICRDFDPLPIGESLVDNGYFVEEPLVVIPKPPTHKYIVVEGNRRLAALKLLLEKELRQVSGDPDSWEKLSKRLKIDVSRVPCVVYSNRDELTTFLGYRHIAGILRWDPLAKARFVDNLVKKKGREADFAKIARDTGSRKPTIRDNYIAYRILLQARDDFDIDTSKLEKNFSVFYRALSNPSITEFIGLNKDKSPRELQSPIPPKKGPALGELIGYIHGTSKVQAVLTDSRQLTKLGEVLSSKQAYSNLRISRNLEVAFQLTGGEERRLIDNLKQASFYLDESLRDVHRHKTSRSVGEEVKRCGDSMFQILRHFPEVKRDLEDQG